MTKMPKSQREPVVEALAADSALDWSSKHPRHSELRVKSPALHDQLQQLTELVLNRRKYPEYELRLGGQLEKLQARWSMGTWAQAGAIYLFAICLKRNEYISVCAVVDRSDLHELMSEGFKESKRGPFAVPGADTLCTVSFRMKGLEFAAAKFDVLARLGYLNPNRGDSDTRPDSLNSPDDEGKELHRRLTIRDEARRDSLVVHQVLKAADGKCALCGDAARFCKDDGLPFLHVHHIHELASNGEDRFDNCVALHADCHAEAHYAPKHRVEEIRTYLQDYRQRNRG